MPPLYRDMRLTLVVVVMWALFRVCLLVTGLASSWEADCRAVKVAGWGCVNPRSTYEPDIKFGLGGFCRMPNDSPDDFTFWADFDRLRVGRDCSAASDTTRILLLVALSCAAVEVLLAVSRAYNDSSHARLVSIVLAALCAAFSAAAAAVFELQCIGKIKTETYLSYNYDVGMYAGSVAVIITSCLSFVMVLINIWAQPPRPYEDAAVYGEDGRLAGGSIESDDDGDNDNDDQAGTSTNNGANGRPLPLPQATHVDDRGGKPTKSKTDWNAILSRGSERRESATSFISSGRPTSGRPHSVETRRQPDR